jgi:alpha-1,2-mannosyltransferase
VVARVSTGFEDVTAATGGCRLLGRGRILTFCAILLVLEVALFLFMAAGTHGLIVPLAKPTSTDFVSFYAAGSLADAGTPELAYDRAAHYAAEERATQPGIVYNFFYYPPVFLLVCAGLARLPYLGAFVLFEATTIVIYLLVLRRILAERGLAILVPILAFPPVLWTIGLGQNGFLTASLLGLATLLIDRRPRVAGLVFGALCCKPHFALLVPVALAAGGRWRAFAAAFASAAALCLLSLIFFGWQTWHAFLVAASGSHIIYESGRIPFSGFVTPFGAVMLLGGTPVIAYAVQIGASLAAAIMVAIVWRRGLPLPIRAASLISGTLVAVPLALFYDLLLAMVAAVWMMCAEKKYRLPEWSKYALMGLYVLTLNPRGMSDAWHLPVGPFVALAFAAVVAAIALRGEAAVPDLLLAAGAQQQPRAAAGP